MENVVVRNYEVASPCTGECSSAGKVEVPQGVDAADEAVIPLTSFLQARKQPAYICSLTRAMMEKPEYSDLTRMKQPPHMHWYLSKRSMYYFDLEMQTLTGSLRVGRIYVDKQNRIKGMDWSLYGCNDVITSECAQFFDSHIGWRFLMPGEGESHLSTIERVRHGSALFEEKEQS